MLNLSAARTKRGKRLFLFLLFLKTKIPSTFRQSLHGNFHVKANSGKKFAAPQVSCPSLVHEEHAGTSLEAFFVHEQDKKQESSEMKVCGAFLGLLQGVLLGFPQGSFLGFLPFVVLCFPRRRTNRPIKALFPERFACRVSSLLWLSQFKASATNPKANHDQTHQTSP